MKLYHYLYDLYLEVGVIRISLLCTYKLIYYFTYYKRIMIVDRKHM